MRSLRKIFPLLSLSFCLISAAAFGGKAPQAVSGYVKFYGNVPFEFAGFETLDGYVYTLQIDEDAKFSLKDLTDLQGFLLELTGEIDDSQKFGLNVLKDGIFIVNDWKRL